MQGLAEQRQINRAILNRHRFQIALAILQYPDSLPLRQCAPQLDHLVRVVDRDHLLRALGQQERKGSLARPKIGDYHRRQQLQQGLSDTLPGTPRHILPPQPPGHVVKKCSRLVLPLAQRELQGRLVVLGLWKLLWRLLQPSEQLGQYLAVRLGPVPNVLARAPILHQARMLQLRQMSGNRALSHAQDLLQFRHGKLLPCQKQEHSQAICIAQNAQRFYD